jgi:opacity protein-like surface antigen
MMMIRYGMAALVAVSGFGAAQAADLTPAQIVARHNAAVAASNVDAMMADYADDAIVLEDGKSIQGKAAIRKLMEGMFPRPVPGVAARGAAAMTVTRTWAEGRVGYYTWDMGAVNGTDEFLVSHGKIAVQAVFLNKPAAAK